MRKVIGLGVFTLFIFLMSSCMRSGSWFPDVDCVTKTVEITTELNPNVLPAKGGIVPISVKAEKIIYHKQFGETIKTEVGPTNFELFILNNPNGFTLIKEGDEYFLNCPPNNRNVPIVVTLVVKVGDHEDRYELTQVARNFHVNVDVVGPNEK